MTTPPMPGRDSLVLAGTIELLGGGVPSTHPSCPGAIFRLAPGYDEGAPQPSADVVTKILTGGRPHGRWADNRTVKLPVIILGRTGRRSSPRGSSSRSSWTSTSSRPAGSGTGRRGRWCWTASARARPARDTRCSRNGRTSPGSRSRSRALPYGRSDVRETVWFPSPVIGGVPAPVYHAWEAVDEYATVGRAPAGAFRGTAGARAGGPARAAAARTRNSAHWNPLAGANTPVYHRVLPTCGAAHPGRGVDITGRQQISLWVGLGNSNGQWRSGT